jgi:hypothetical protein
MPVCRPNSSAIRGSDPDEQAAITEILALRTEGWSLMRIRDEMRAKGFPISHQLVANTIARHAETEGPA